MNILVTGGAGYIGSHTTLQLLSGGHKVVVVDSLINSSAESLKRVEKLSGKQIPLHIFDLRDNKKLAKLFSDNDFDAVIHFAGLKSCR